MRQVIPQSTSRQIALGISVAGILVGLATPVIKLVWLEYTNGGLSTSETALKAGAIDLLGSLVVPLSLAGLFFALFVGRRI